MSKRLSWKLFNLHGFSFSVIFYVISLARLVLQISYLSQLRHRIVPGRTLGLGAPVLAEDREPVDVSIHISKGFVYLFVRLLWAKKCSFTTFSHVFSASQIYELEVAFLRAVSGLTSEPRTTTSELFGTGGKLHSYFEETIELNAIQCFCLCNDVSLTFTPVLQSSRKRTCLCVHCFSLCKYNCAVDL